MVVAEAKGGCASALTVSVETAGSKGTESSRSFARWFVGDELQSFVATSRSVLTLAVDKWKANLVAAACLGWSFSTCTARNELGFGRAGPLVMSFDRSCTYEPP